MSKAAETVLGFTTPQMKFLVEQTRKAKERGYRKGVRDAARVCAQMDSEYVKAMWAATRAGRELVASHRQSDIETIDRLRDLILSLLIKRKGV